MSGKKGMHRYPTKTKLDAVRMFYEEGRRQKEIAALLGVSDPQRIEKWMKQYRQEGENAFTKPIGRPRKKAESEEQELKRLRMENALLKKYHTELRGVRLAQRNIGRSTTTEKNTK